MPIIQIITDTPGQINSPNVRRVKIITTDNLAKVVAAGYLNPQTLQGYTIYNTDEICLWYGAVATQSGVSSPGTFEVFTASISNGVITLVPWVDLANVLLPVVAGNVAQFNGTTGQVSDSGVSAASISGGITQIGALYQVSVTFTPAQMVTAYDTPLQIVANPSASQVIVVHSATVYTASTGHTAYATGTAPIIQYSSGGTNGAHGAGTIATAAGLVAGDITAATSQVRTLLQAASAAETGLSGLGIYFSNATGDYTGGTGTNITITLVYEVLTATI